MHSTDKQLLNLLVDDEGSSELQAIAQHVEACSHCQTRLHKLSGAGRWTNEVVAQLRTSGYTSDSDGLEPTAEILRTIVDSQTSDSESSEIEADPIRLDFLSAPAHPELLGRLGRYDIERVIGAGGMGIVLKGYDSELHRAVAIKVLAPHLAHSAAARRRFAREAQATAAVIHPNVIPIYNVESEGKTPYLVMRFINGQSLQARVDQQGPLTVIDALRIAQQTAAGLAAAHAQGLIHRDVKPANILLDEGIERVVLSDFGLARTVDDASLTHTGIVTGTPHYMSPEQAGGDAIDCRSDLFSLGCVLWFMLTGRPPFRAATAMGVLNRICHDTHHDIRQINGCVPVPLARIIDRLLAKHPDERMASAQALDHALLEVTRAIQTGQLPLDTPTCASSVRTRRRLATASACLIVVLLGLVGKFRSGLTDSDSPNTSAAVAPLVVPPSTPTPSEAQVRPLKSDQSAASVSGAPKAAPTAGDRPPGSGEGPTAIASGHRVPASEPGDRWYSLADALQQELHTLEARDNQALQWWQKTLEHNALQSVEHLSRDLDALMQDTSALTFEPTQPSAEPASGEGGAQRR